MQPSNVTSISAVAKENTKKIRFATIAACIGTLTLMQTDVARSQAISTPTFTCWKFYDVLPAQYECFGHVYGIPNENLVAYMKAVLSATGPPVIKVGFARKPKKR